MWLASVASALMPALLSLAVAASCSHAAADRSPEDAAIDAETGGIPEAGVDGGFTNDGASNGADTGIDSASDGANVTPDDAGFSDGGPDGAIPSCPSSILDSG